MNTSQKAMIRDSAPTQIESGRLQRGLRGEIPGHIVGMTSPAPLELPIHFVTAERTSLKLSEEGWVERRCSRCHEWWPATTEFFSPQPNNPIPLHSSCKACIAEWRAERRRQDPDFAARDAAATARWLANRRVQVPA